LETGTILWRREVVGKMRLREAEGEPERPLWAEPGAAAAACSPAAVPEAAVKAFLPAAVPGAAAAARWHEAGPAAAGGFGRRPSSSVRLA